MTEPWLNVHPDFTLNGKSYSLAKLINLAEALQVEGDKEDKELALFLLDWLYPKHTMLLKTSGTTGSPKTVQLDKTRMIASAKATGAYFDLPAGTKALHCLSFNYIAGKMMFVRALVLGWHIEVVLPSREPLSQTKNSFDFAAMVPLQVRESLDKLHRIKQVIVGGAPVSEVLRQQLQDVPSRMYATYGMTETITHVAIKKLNHCTHEEQEQQAYDALPDVTFSIDDRSCLVIDAPEVATEPVVTNDVVKLLSGTAFQWLGRADFVINSGGVKIHPEQVEQVLDLVIDAPFFISSLPDEDLGQKVVLVIEGREDIFPEVDYVGLQPYEIPKEIFFVNEMIYTTTGKINREATLKGLTE
ncbi:MAG: AMP-binding protein [Flavobacteriaceae bacterium]